MRARIGSLFSGIGGLELGLERAGLGRVVWQCESDPFARRVLAKHWPDAHRYDDIKTMGLCGKIEQVEVICGGFPCQDISVAGKGAGISGERSGLFYELMRIVRLVRPRVVVLENVSALTSRGLGEVLGELAEAGFDAEWSSISAGAIAAPHRRERIFIVAYANGVRELQQEGGQREQRERAGDGGDSAPVAHAAGIGRGEVCVVSESTAETCAGFARDSDHVPAVPHANSQFLRQQPGGGRRARGCEEEAIAGGDGLSGRMAGVLAGADLEAELWEARGKHSASGGAFDPQPCVGGEDDGLPRWVDRREWERGVERAIPRGKPFMKRRQRLSALGNAVVPQVSELVGVRIASRLVE
ncbi:MAG: DNA (cytosine-5-)-methyltransferase [Gammaproteobacteria bacterium]|nr:DNA (cytosine-5-)-methyltransferase [Gammaproteobacteria bacterium]